VTNELLASPEKVDLIPEATVLTGTTDEVIHCPVRRCKELVVASLSPQGVLPIVANERVVTRATPEHVMSTLAGGVVVAIEGTQHIGTIGPGHHVLVFAAHFGASSR
jgi:hypothetical protein